MFIYRFLVWSLLLISTMSAAHDEFESSLITAYAPLVKLHPYETYLPTAVENFREQSTIYTASGDEIGPATDDLSQLKDDYYLKYNEDDINGLPLQGEEVVAPVYVHIKDYPNKTFTDIQYFFFYAYNGCSYFRVGYKYMLSQRKRNLPICNFARHQGDWEHVTVRVNEDGSFQQMYFSQHGKGRWFKPDELEWEDSHPVVYPALHSHSNLPSEQVLTQEELPISGLKFISSINWMNVIDVSSANNSETLRYQWMPDRDFSPQWRTWTQNQMIVVSGDEDWLKFRGHWGATLDNRSVQALPKIDGTVAQEISMFSHAAIKFGLVKDRYLKGYGPRTPSAKKLWRAPE